MSRLATGGLIDRSETLEFCFDARILTAHPGDTLASALLANDVRLVGRSFKYHRPRGIMSAGSEEPNALVTVGHGAAANPNTRATVQEVFDGLHAFSQNRWPSLDFDALAVNNLLSPLLGAGFYYKTFMWPPKFWEKLYEPAIRRAAGLGRLSGEPDPDHHEKAFAFCDLLVIGAGPAGLMAALTAGRAGARVILADEDFRMGGRLNAERGEVGGMPGAGWAAGVVGELSEMPNVRLMRRTAVTGIYDCGTYGALGRVAQHVGARPDDVPTQCFWRIAARRAVLCAGAIERPIAFPGNDRPGIMLAGAVRAFANRWAVAAGRRVTVFTNNDDGWRSAVDLAAAGVEVAALIDARLDVELPEGPWRAFAGAAVTGTRGRSGLSAVRVRDAGGERWIDAECLGVSGGWNPAVHLTCHLGGRPVWDDAIAAFVPAAGAVPGLAVAGAATGAFSTAAALRQGRDAAMEALELERGPDLSEAEDGPVRVKPFWHVTGAKGRAWIDFQNDVTVKDVESAHRENFRSVEHMKRYTTLGMATDQGKTANVCGLAVLAELAGQAIADVGTTTFRPPWTPVPIGAMGAGGAGKGLASERFTPLHGRMEALSAVFVESGLWHRAAYFPREDDAGWRDACDREVGFVRNAAGVCDVTTLGKIDVQGSDAAAFLDRVYGNRISSVKVGRARYGIMLREDGFVMDDGVVARLEQARFLLTTTTGAAGQVMAHLEFCAQCLWPEMNVAVTSVTEQWAQIAVAGPKSREVLDGVLDAPFDDASLPYMGCGAMRVAGVGGRLFRVSFSGEHAYEVAVPARYGAALWDVLLKRAEMAGGGAYGLEALNVLRIEKGFVTHAEIDGRTSADDLGLGRMVAAKDCVGRVASLRPGLSGPEREQLVGLVPVNRGATLLAGAHVVARGAAAERARDEGWLSSVCHSPTLGHSIALGFVRDGRARTGERVDAICLLRGSRVECEIAPPAFFDPDGERMRG